MKWALILFDSVEKSRIVKILYLDRMADIAYICGEPAQRLSNLYHGIIRPSGVLRFIHIEQVG